MNPIHFKEVNVEFAKDQPEYNTLPAFINDSPKGEVITCWRLSFKERLYILFNGNVWLSLMTFNSPLTPSYMSVKKSDVLIVPKKTIYKSICGFFKFYSK